MYDLALVPLSENPNPRPAKIKDFDTEQSAIDFAKSERKKWHRVTVHKAGTDREIVAFHGDDMYVGDKRTRLKED
jgi:hypothetical protein